PCYLRHRVPARLGRKRGSQQRPYSEAFYVNKGRGCGLESLEPKKCADDLIKSSSPPQRNRAGNPGAELLAAAASREKRLVDALDIDAAILHGFHIVGDLDELARCGIGIGGRARIGELHAQPPPCSIPHSPLLLGRVELVIS